MYNSAIQLKMFDEISLWDTFFDSLRNSYNGFQEWFQRKSFQGEKAYVLEECGIQGFLYLKEEIGKDLEVFPPLPEFRKLKVGTFKVNPHGTKLGERFIKIIFDQMLSRDITFSYLTVYSEHQGLIGLLQEYGFYYWGKKGIEDVYVKDFTNITGDAKKDYPLINMDSNNHFLLSIYPKYHTKLFPDSQLKTERQHYIEDLSYTNSIEKIYLSGSADILNYSYGDLVIIYRTGEGGAAEYTSVATSVCTLVNVVNIKSFVNVEAFLDFCDNRTIFTEKELRYFWATKKYPYIITLLYNLALPHRIIRKHLIENVGISRGARIVVYPLEQEQTKTVFELSHVPQNILK